MKTKWALIGTGIFASFWAGFYIALILAGDESGEAFYHPPRSDSA